MLWGFWAPATARMDNWFVAAHWMAPTSRAAPNASGQSIRGIPLGDFFFVRREDIYFVENTSGV